MWARLINAGLGVWLMAAPGVLGYGPPLSINDHLVGPLIVASATVAVWAVLRPLRRVNLVLGLWLLVAPWALSAGWPAVLNTPAVGAIVAGLSLVRGRVTTPFAGGWSVLWREDPYGMREEPGERR